MNNNFKKAISRFLLVAYFSCNGLILIGLHRRPIHTIIHVYRKYIQTVLSNPSQSLSAIDDFFAHIHFEF